MVFVNEFNDSFKKIQICAKIKQIVLFLRKLCSDHMGTCAIDRRGSMTRPSLRRSYASLQYPFVSPIFYDPWNQERKKINVQPLCSESFKGSEIFKIRVPQGPRTKSKTKIQKTFIQLFSL